MHIKYADSSPIIFYSDDDMTKKSTITPVPTVFLLRHYQSTNHQNIVPPKEYCRHRCNFTFFRNVLV